ncbi:hypothetical protein EU555_32705 [Methylobacterium nonmethylotrophicum]|uniref:Uncharacterized protein n=1 Tax=Methylobacterium nonmethylotrophicum TaxID=1141884 RepID=A0A4Z0NEP7_9HYPH|nr:hypothetical protein EU555_32705 [Methylobacterium nonmethylotrophicum]
MHGGALRALVAGAVVLLTGFPAHAFPTKPVSLRVAVRYAPPADPAHREIYRTAQRQRVLERLGEIVSLVRLPHRLTFRMEGCGGEPNAWYDPESRSVTMCYEMVAAIVNLAPRTKSPAGVTRDQAIRGPVAQILLHETSHALFHLLRVPIFGREEDAADQLASLILLQLAPARARDVVNGSGYFFATLGRQEPMETGRFADVHGLSWQRFYNLVCLAYGSNPHRYGDIVAKGYLPKERAERCGEETEQVSYAFERLIVPHLRVRPHRGANLRRAWRSR